MKNWACCQAFRRNYTQLFEDFLPSSCRSESFAHKDISKAEKLG